MIRAVTFPRGEKDMKNCIWGDQTEAGGLPAELNVFSLNIHLIFSETCHITHTQSMNCAYGAVTWLKGCLFFVFLPAGASHQPQLDLSSAVKSPLKMALLCPRSPTSCGLLRFSLISQRDFSSLASFSSVTVLRHNFNILPTPFEHFERNGSQLLHRLDRGIFSAVDSDWIFLPFSPSYLCRCIPPGVGHQ